jgi:hypothetical protein
MFQNLIRFGDHVYLNDSQHRTDRAQEQQLTAWIMIGVFVLVTIIGFYLLGREFDIYG